MPIKPIMSYLDLKSSLNLQQCVVSEHFGFHFKKFILVSIPFSYLSLYSGILFQQLEKIIIN